VSKHEVEPFAVKPLVAAVMENCSVDRIYKLLRAGELEGFKDGRNTKITMASIKARRARLIATKPFPRAADSKDATA
jgi:hypothetical protein